MSVQKVYIDVGTGPTNPVTLSFVTSGSGFDRSWRVRIAQIPCSSIFRAEEGCMQYFTGVSGQIKSFNYDPNVGLQLSNQDYSICIRMERNFCGIQYMTCDDGGQFLLLNLNLTFIIIIIRWQHYLVNCFSHITNERSDEHRSAAAATAAIASW